MDDVDWSYNAGSAILTLTLDESKVTVEDAYSFGDYVWAGRIVSSENPNSLNIQTYKFWQVVGFDTTFNTLELSVPASDAGIFIDTGAGDADGTATLLLSSTNMTELMHYYQRI